MKLQRYTFVLGHSQFVARDNEGDGNQTPADDGNQTPADDGNQTPEGDDKTFNQDDVNKIVVQRNKALKAEFEKLETNYQQILEQKSLTEQQREKIEKDLENVQAQLRTKEQQAAHEAKQAAEKHQAALNETKTEADYYRNLYESSTIEREITQSSLENDGYNPQQFIAVLGPRTKMVDELDAQGQKTGKLVPRVEETVEGEDGTPTTVLSTVNEAILRMKDRREFGNFFKSNVARGIGSATDNSAAGNLDPSTITTEEYIKNAEAIRKQIGYTPRR